jgi:hypothetical protein
VGATVLVACRNHLDLIGAPDASTLTAPPTVDAGDIPVLDSGLGSDAYPACASRPTGDCMGQIDFPCNFDGWVAKTAAACQAKTGCKTNGWMEVKLGADGCVAELGMDDPSDDMVACLLAELGSVRCVCDPSTTTYFFGDANMGVCKDGGPLG